MTTTNTSGTTRRPARTPASTTTHKSARGGGSGRPSGARKQTVRGVGQRPPFRWTCPACDRTVVTLLPVLAPPTCSAHTGGGRTMVATRIRFKDVP